MEGERWKVEGRKLSERAHMRVRVSARPCASAGSCSVGKAFDSARGVWTYRYSELQ